MFPERVNGEGGKAYGSPAGCGLRRFDSHACLGVLQAPLDSEGGGLKVEVRPAQRGYLAAPSSGAQRDRHYCVERMAFELPKRLRDLVGRKYPQLRAL